MIPKELLQKIKSIEIRTRRLVNSTFSNEYHSVFKGQGIDFANIREYQPGDDFRFMDWKVTARTGRPHIKEFREERELPVILMYDLSASKDFGSIDQTKAEIAAEVAAVLGFSAVYNQDKVGLLLFSDQIELFIPPKKGKQHMLRLVRDIFCFNPHSKKTDIGVATNYLVKMIKKKAIVFIISDFLDPHVESALSLISRKHDVVPIVLSDPREHQLLNSGILSLEDNETGETLYLNSSLSSIREAYQNIILTQQLELDRVFKSLKMDCIKIDISGSYLLPLSNYFIKRSKRV
jgi:uncharacterized protein (DUF58 family)